MSFRRCLAIKELDIAVGETGRMLKVWTLYWDDEYTYVVVAGDRKHFHFTNLLSNHPLACYKRSCGLSLKPNIILQCGGCNANILTQESTLLHTGKDSSATGAPQCKKRRRRCLVVSISEKWPNFSDNFILSAEEDEVALVFWDMFNISL